ncbi:hypothetical protein RB623_29380 [Mesorhizobium sp. LHD-90]|uniref:hypothetical protein n=1 Tax=Mesorhizobium sp. LHD-90 TaxID=3071414 RepID=UPI0027DFAFBB|nr:hypothetical protein [Mesorhizobium sp. LHD-90]MDQ6438181.1 hypothetical protein [Mesorhizobium sp. LHD-90]
MRALDALEHHYDRASTDNMINVASKLHITLCRRVSRSLREQGHPRIAILYDRRAFDRVLTTVRSGDYMGCARTSLLELLDEALAGYVATLETAGTERGEIEDIVDGSYQAAIQLSSATGDGLPMSRGHRFGSPQIAEVHAG